MESGVQKLGFYALLVFVYLRFSFLHEFAGAKLHANLHLIILVGGISYVCWLLSGHALRGFRELSSKLWLGFVCWMALATATSFWKGGSVPLFLTYAQTNFPVILVIPALVRSRRHIVRMVDVIGLACITTVLLGAVNDDFTSGRMGVDVASSEIQNPNDFAAHLILMLPVLGFWAFREGRGVIRKVIAIVCMGLCLREILSSGSRGALISLALTGLYLALFGNKRVKIALLAGVPLLALAAIPFVPKESILRLETLFSSSAAVQQGGEAVESQQARVALLQESLKFTFQHPLTGIGPGEFMDFQAQTAAENGERGMWHVTHNAYTQVSSECGIPAFLLFAGALTVTILNLRQVKRTGDTTLAPIAATLLVMYIGFGICIFFLSMAYSVHILILSALAATMKLRLSGKVEAREASGSAPVREVVPA